MKIAWGWCEDDVNMIWGWCGDVEMIFTLSSHQDNVYAGTHCDSCVTVTMV